MRTKPPVLRSLLLALAGAIVGFVTTRPSRAEAVWHQRIGASCFNDSGTTVGPDNDFTAVGNYSSSDRMALRCPIVDGSGATGDDSFTKASTTTLTVYYDDNNDDSVNGSVVSKACISYIAGGGTCGSAASSGATTMGAASLSPPTSSV